MSKIIFFDTETTGLPNQTFPGCGNTHSFDGQPRPVQIGWVVTDENGTVIKECNRFIRPDDFTMPERTSIFNGIYQKDLLEKGEDEKSVLVDFVSDLFESVFGVGHNVDFDKDVIIARLRSVGLSLAAMKMENQQFLCTMRTSCRWCGMGKYPKLTELHKKLFGREFDGAHDALADVRATKDCYFELVKRGVLPHI